MKRFSFIVSDILCIYSMFPSTMKMLLGGEFIAFYILMAFNCSGFIVNFWAAITFAENLRWGSILIYWVILKKYYRGFRNILQWNLKAI